MMMLVSNVTVARTNELAIIYNKEIRLGSGNGKGVFFLLGRQTGR